MAMTGGATASSTRSTRAASPDTRRRRHRRPARHHRPPRPPRRTLGVDAIWLSPIYPSPGLDVGYDVSDHAAVDPLFGTEDDFDRLVAEAHGRGHPRDPRSRHEPHERRAPLVPGESRRRATARTPTGTCGAIPPADADGRPLPPNNWLSCFGGPAWAWERAREQFYLHTFLAQQPELNWRNPAVEAAQFDMVRGWLDRGVDGFRLDVFNAFLKHPDAAGQPGPDRGDRPWARQRHLYDRDQPDFADLIARFRAIVDERARPHVGRRAVRRRRPNGGRALGRAAPRLRLGAARGALVGRGVRVGHRGARGGVRCRTAGRPIVLSNHDQPRQATRAGRVGRHRATRDAVARAAAVAAADAARDAVPVLRRGDRAARRRRSRATRSSIRRRGVRWSTRTSAWWNRDQCRAPMPWTPEDRGRLHDRPAVAAVRRRRATAQRRRRRPTIRGRCSRRTAG